LLCTVFGGEINRIPSEEEVLLLSGIFVLFLSELTSEQGFSKSEILARYWWLMPVILPTQKAAIRKITF
jgi:hypothetical protein